MKKFYDTHSAEAIVLSCIDYRFIDNMIEFLEKSDISEKYDVTALAGASLAYNQSKYEYWNKTFIDQLKLAIDLHHIKKIIVFDHMDCGAYRIFYPKLNELSEKKRNRLEKKLHKKNIRKFFKKMGKLFPQLDQEGYLILYDGRIKKIRLN